MMAHWESPLKELAAQRMRRRSEGRTETEVIEIPDDDDSKGMSMEELEKQSLQKAEQGIIIVDGDETLEDDGYANPEDIGGCEAAGAMPKENTMPEENPKIQEKPETLKDEKPKIEEKSMSEESKPAGADHGKDQSVDAADAEAKKRREELIRHLALLWMFFPFFHSYIAHGFKS